MFKWYSYCKGCSIGLVYGTMFSWLFGTIVAYVKGYKKVLKPHLLHPPLYPFTIQLYLNNVHLTRLDTLVIPTFTYYKYNDTLACALVSINICSSPRALSSQSWGIYRTGYSSLSSLAKCVSFTYTFKNSCVNRSSILELCPISSYSSGI